MAMRQEQQRTEDFIRLQKSQMSGNQSDSQPTELATFTNHPNTDLYEAEHLLLTLENLQIEQQQLKSELNDMEIDLNRLKNQHVLFTGQGKKYLSTSNIQPITMSCSEVHNDEADGLWLKEIVKQLEVQKVALANEMKGEQQELLPPPSSITYSSTLSPSQTTGLASESSCSSITSESASRTKLFHQQLECIHEQN